MSDATEHRPTTPFPAEGAASLPRAALDPLAGDWSDGLRGPVRALGVPTPRLLLLDGVQQPEAPRAVPLPPPIAPVAEEIEAPDAWSATADPLESTPPPSSEPPSVIVSFTEPPEPAPVAAAAEATAAEAVAGLAPEIAPPTPALAFLPDVTPATPAPAFPPDVTPSTPAPAFLPDVTPQAPAAFLPDVTPAAPAPAFLPDVTPAASAPAFLPDVTPAAPAPAFLPDVTPAAPAPAFLPDVTPPAPAAAFQPDAAPAPASQDEGVVELSASEAVAADGPTPWSEPVAAAPAASEPVWTTDVAATGAAPDAWEMPPPQPAVVEAATEAAPEAVAEAALEAAVDDAWSTPPPAAEPAVEWSAEAPPGDWEEVRKPAAPVMDAPPAADWGTLSSGPDWSSPPAAEAAPEADDWGSAPPPPAASAWDAPAAAAEPSAWEAAPAAASAEAEWSAPAATAPPVAAPSWNAAPVGASALEQLDSEPPEVEAAPGAAQELFGSVPLGSSLSDDAAPEELGAPEELSAPEELASPEEFLTPVDLDDPDLLVPVDEDQAPPAPPAQPLAAFHPVALGALVVPGEHRVAVHTRGGRTRRGSLKDVDLGKAQFSLIPQGGGAAEPVYHAEVKAIFFMLAPGEKPAPATGEKVRVTFADGRTIEGHRDGADTAKHGFFLVPLDAARTNTRRIYVAREATTDVKDG